LTGTTFSTACVSGTSIIAVCVAKSNGGIFSRDTGTGKKVFAMKCGLALASFPAGGTAVVIGVSGAIGAAFIETLRQAPSFVRVIGLGRSTAPALELTVESSIAAAAAALGAIEPRLVIDARGFYTRQGACQSAVGATWSQSTWRRRSRSMRLDRPY